MAIYMMTMARKGIPSTQMAHELGITQKSAWFLAQRIRETWLGGSSDSDMGDHVQIDETYVGGFSGTLNSQSTTLSPITYAQISPPRTIMGSISFGF